MKVFNGAIALACAVATTAAYAADVKEVGSFHVGGQQLTLSGLPVKELVYTAGGPPTKMDPNGDFHTGQMYVQYVKLNNPRSRYPLLLWHGGGLTGVTWETKPDGKPGWMKFLHPPGHPMSMCRMQSNAVVPLGALPEINKSAPFFRTKKEAWEIFRIGADRLLCDSEPAKRISSRLTKLPGRCLRCVRRSRACRAGRRMMHSHVGRPTMNWSPR